MSTLALAPTANPLAPKAVRSEDYVRKVVAARQSNPQGLTVEGKRERLRMVLADQQNGITRVGKAMIGPIQLRLRYQGVVRNILVESPVEPGVPPEYEIFDELGQAYLMSGTEGEVRISAYEGKRTRVWFFRVAARPMVRFEDLYHLKMNIVEQAQDEAKQRIMEQEDARLITLLQAAVTAYATRPDHLVTPNHNVTETSGYFSPGSLYSAVAQTDMHRIQSGRILVSPFDVRDFYRWDINQTGWAFKDRTVAGETITQFGEFYFQRSVMVPTGKMFILPNPDFLGFMPVLYSLTVEENHLIEAFYRGWVFHEMISMAVVNPAGISTVTKP